MKIVKNKFLINFSSLHLRHIKVSNFTSGWVKYHARWETGDSWAVTSIQEHLFGDFSSPQLFFVCRGKKLCG